MVSFTKLGHDDLAIIHKWLNKDHVKEFYGYDNNQTLEFVTKKYLKRINEHTMDMYIFAFNGIKIGYLQSYDITNTSLYGLNEKAIGIDIYIGEEDYIGVGFGTTILRTYIKDYIFERSTANFVVIDPEINNIRAIRSYEKSGFKHYSTALSEGSTKKLTCYMLLSREDFFGK